jgi:predicted enzyme related to lactoylglutathione lyase
VTDDEVMWQVASTGWLYVVRDRERAGRALITLPVDDLDRLVAELADRDVRSDPIEIVGDAGRRAVLTDPEGNSISFIEVASS